MSEPEGLAAINNRRGTNIQEILEAIFVNLAAHPYINEPPIFDEAGNPIRITLFRDYAGIDLENTNEGQLTLSIYPYTFSASDEGSTLTTNTTNASIVYQPYSLGRAGTPLGPMDKAVAHIVFKLHTFGYNTQTSGDPFAVNNQLTKFQFNKTEQTLRRWGEVLRLILTSDLQRLPSINYPARPLIANSFVKSINFDTARWDKGSNLVFHTCTLVWEVDYYCKRNIGDWNKIEIAGGCVGTIPDPTDPDNTVPVCYNLAQDRYYNCDTDETLEKSNLVDPATGRYYDSLATSVIRVVDSINQSRKDFITISETIQEG